MAEIESFVGDGSNPKENPHDFLRKWQRSLVRSKDDDKDKIATFQYYLSTGSVADEWFDGLEEGKKASMAEFLAAFGVRWPKVKVAKKTAAQYEVELLGYKLTEEEVGKKVERYGREVFSHVAWAEKVREMVQGAGVDVTTKATYLGQVRQNLPDTLQDQLQGDFDTWDAYLDKVTKLSADTVTRIARRLTEARMEREAISRQLDELKSMRIPPQPSSPTAPLRRAMASTTISGVPPPPRFNNVGRSSPQNMVYQRVTSQGPANVSSLPPLSEQERQELRSRLDSLPHQPNTPAGQTAYQAQISTWQQQHGVNTRVDHTKPYPLTPGTAPVCSGECFRCGAHGHIGSMCSLPREQWLPLPERDWRRLCFAYLTAFRRHQVQQVNLVLINAVEMESGNGEGPSV